MKIFVKYLYVLSAVIFLLTISTLRFSERAVTAPEQRAAIADEWSASWDACRKAVSDGARHKRDKLAACTKQTDKQWRISDDT